MSYYVPSDGNCFIVVRASVTNDNKQLKYKCAFCDDYHYHGYFSGETSPTFRSCECPKCPEGTDVMLHFNTQSSSLGVSSVKFSQVSS